MARMVLETAGRALGDAVLPGLGGQIGAALGGVAGAALDRRLFGGDTRPVRGPEDAELKVFGSKEGDPLARVYGRARVAGQVIWLDGYRRIDAAASGGKGPPQATPASEPPRYVASFAVALCEGPIDGVDRVWADGAEIALRDYQVRVHLGAEDQARDPLLETMKGVRDCPGFRGTAYVVFEDFPLDTYGGRLPQLNFEVRRAARGGLEDKVTAVTLIPGSGEFVYADQQVRKILGPGVSETLNAHSHQADTDLEASLDQLARTFPNCRAVALVVSWFGTDLRCGETEIAPGAEARDIATEPLTWRVCDVGRDAAHLISRIDGAPAFGGTPSDQTVVACIRALKARGYAVALYPFVMMDIPAGNGLPDPYGRAEQATYPWRGRITCDPGPGADSTVDKTGAARAQIDAFFGDAQPADFVLDGDAIAYSGPNAWRFRRFILHHACLAAVAGGVEAFYVGTEMRGLTTLRDADGAFPAVEQFIALASDVRSILGVSTKISYAADWSEYFGYQPADGSGDVLFHLDPFWADPNVDFVAIDYYAPLADWRDGPAHADLLAGARSTYALDYLSTNLRAGEGFDWFYASAEDRDAQRRSPIEDGAHGEPWVFRYKDVWSWWANKHHDRIDGERNETATAWVPESKPIVLSEVGCPAIDKGANQPNLFVDPKSAESATPHYSSGARDDLIQRRYLEAVYDLFSSGPEANPVSSVYGGPMIDPARIYAWTWDARPYPEFPALADVWRDSPNWALGHWLNGRAGQMITLADLIRMIAEDMGAGPVDVSHIDDVLEGYVLERPIAARDALEPLLAAFRLDVAEADGVLRFWPRGGGDVVAISRERLAATDGGEPILSIESDSPSAKPDALRLAFVDAERDYQKGAADARTPQSDGRVEMTTESAIVTTAARAQALVDAMLVETRRSDARATFALPLSHLAIEPGDVLEFGGIDGRFRVTQTVFGDALEVEAVRIDPAIGRIAIAPDVAYRPGGGRRTFGAPEVVAWEAPLLSDAEDLDRILLAAFAEPWPDGLSAFLLKGGVAESDPRAKLIRAAVLGRTRWDFYSGPRDRWDEGNMVEVEIFGARGLESREALDVLNGANRLAIENPDGEWEIVGFRNAELAAPQRYRLSGFLRGLRGTEVAMGNPTPAGARFVLLDDAVSATPLTPEERGAVLTLRVGPSEAPPSSDTYREAQVMHKGLTRRPYAPAHLIAWRAGDGGVEIRWVRRARIGGDDWSAPDVPLGERFERYQVTLSKDGARLRSYTVESPAAVYASEDQMADFAGGLAWGGVQIEVAQISEAHGAGAVASIVTWL